MTGFLLALAVFVLVRAWGQRRRRVHKATSTPSATSPVLSYREASFQCGCHFKDGTLEACEAHEALLEASRR